MASCCCTHSCNTAEAHIQTQTSISCNPGGSSSVTTPTAQQKQCCCSGKTQALEASPQLAARIATVMLLSTPVSPPAPAPLLGHTPCPPRTSCSRRLSSFSCSSLSLSGRKAVCTPGSLPSLPNRGRLGAGAPAASAAGSAAAAAAVARLAAQEPLFSPAAASVLCPVRLHTRLDLYLSLSAGLLSKILRQQQQRLCTQSWTAVFSCFAVLVNKKSAMASISPFGFREAGVGSADDELQQRRLPSCQQYNGQQTKKCTA